MQKNKPGMKSLISLAKLEKKKKKKLDLANAFATWLVSLKICDDYMSSHM